MSADPSYDYTIGVLGGHLSQSYIDSPVGLSSRGSCHASLTPCNGLNVMCSLCCESSVRIRYPSLKTHYIWPLYQIFSTSGFWAHHCSQQRIAFYCIDFYSLPSISSIDHFYQIIYIFIYFWYTFPMVLTDILTYILTFNLYQILIVFKYLKLIKVCGKCILWKTVYLVFNK